MARAAARTSVDQVFDVLGLIAVAGAPIGLAEVARRLEIPTSTAHRVLLTLVTNDYVARDVDGPGYQLGVMAEELGDAFFSRFAIREVAGPHLRRLVALTGESVTLTVQVGWYAVRVAGVEGWREISARLALGRATPLDAGAAARLLLASLDDEEVRAFLRWRGGDHPAARELWRELVGLRGQRQIAESPRPGEAAAVAFAVRDAEHRTRAAITIEGNRSVLRWARPPLSRRCRAVLDDLESAVRAQPEVLADPHRHVPRDKVELSCADRIVL